MCVWVGRVRGCFPAYPCGTPTHYSPQFGCSSVAVVGNWLIYGRKCEQNEQKGCLLTTPVRVVLGKRFFAPSGWGSPCEHSPACEVLGLIRTRSNGAKRAIRRIILRSFARFAPFRVTTVGRFDCSHVRFGSRGVNDDAPQFLHRQRVRPALVFPFLTSLFSHTPQRC